MARSPRRTRNRRLMIGQQITDPGPQPFPGDEMLLQSLTLPATAMNPGNVDLTNLVIASGSLIEGDVLIITTDASFLNTTGANALETLALIALGNTQQLVTEFDLPTANELHLRATTIIRIGDDSNPAAVPFTWETVTTLDQSGTAQPASTVISSGTLDTTNATGVQVTAQTDANSANNKFRTQSHTVQKLRAA